MADQCIVCLEDLDSLDLNLEVAANPTPEQQSTHPSKSTNNDSVALIKPCNHVLHDECLRAWSQKANSCPICRQTFNLVEVLDKVGGTILSEYAVEDKKQVADFDPNAWVDDQFEEEEEARPCPICGEADQEEVLLLCDSCDAPYHTHCIGLGDRIPNGQWFCMECADDGAYTRAAAAAQDQVRVEPITGRRGPRTQAAARRSRQRMRNDHWVGAWSIFSSRIHNVSGVDLDFSDDDLSMADYRRHQRRTSDQERNFYQRWRQRQAIAARQGGGAVFPASPPVRVRSPSPVETVEETRAWGAFEKAKEIDTKSPRSRKRKSRSVTASPVEGSSRPAAEPERKLKRPRTRRVPNQSEASSSSMAGSSRPTNGRRAESPTARILNEAPGQPSFLSSLLKEVEMNAGSDDDRSAFSGTTHAGPNRVTSPSLDFSSPAASPVSSSPYHSPRASSITPPPHISKRSLSPLSLTSRVEPIFQPAHYSPNRSPPENKTEHAQSSPTTELRQPRPRRRHPVTLPRSEDASPTRAELPIEAKEGISKIVKSALAPHWKSMEITKEQYADINRAVSRKLYETINSRNLNDEKERSTYEKIASVEVATAVKALKV